MEGEARASVDTGCDCSSEYLMKNIFIRIALLLTILVSISTIMNVKVIAAYSDLPYYYDEDAVSVQTGAPTYACDITEETESDVATELTVKVENDERIEETDCVETDVAEITEPIKVTESTEPQTENNEGNIDDVVIDVVTKIEFAPVDEILYVTAQSLNVRIGPGVEYAKIDNLIFNTEVHRVGIAENGWSKIEHENGEAYVSSDYLSYEKYDVVEQELSESNKSESSNSQNNSIQEEINAKKGMVGRLTIPTVSVDVGLFSASIKTGSNAQEIVDEQDSAAYLIDATEYYGQILIADHVHQGFSGIKSSVVGETIAYINFGTHVESFVCTKVFIGVNTGHDLVDMHKVSIAGKNDGGLCMYTCNSDGTITITYWRPNI